MGLKVGELFASFSVDSSGVQDSLDSIQKSCNSVANGLALGGAAMTAGVTMPLVKAAKAIYNTGTEFYAQMSRVGALSNASEADMQALNDAALEIGSKTLKTSLEAGQALEYMALAGWNTASMIEALPGVINLSIASGEDLASVSDIVTDAMTAFGLSMREAERQGIPFSKMVTDFSDVLAKAATSSNTTVGMMGEAFKFVAPAAGQLGYSVEDIAISLGLMANNGIKATMAGTALRNVFTRMATEPKATAEAMEKLGLSMVDESGNMLSWMSIMQDMRSSFRKMGMDTDAYQSQMADLNKQLADGTITQEQYNILTQELAENTLKMAGVDAFAAAKALAGQQGLSGLLAIIGASDEDFASLTKNIYGAAGATQVMADRMSDNAKGKVALFNSAVEGLQVTIWTLADGAFQNVVEKATSFIDTFRQMDSETQIAALRMAGLAAATGPAMLAASGLIKAAMAAGPALGALSGAAGILGFGFAAMAIAAVDANNDIGKNLEKMAKTGKKNLQTFDKSVHATFTNIRSRLPAVTQSMATAIKDIVPAAVSSAGNMLGEMFDTFASNSGDFGEVAVSLVTSFIDGLASGLPDLIPKAASMVTSIATTIVSNLPELIAAGGQLVSSLWQGIQGTDWLSLGSQLWESVKGAFNETGDWIKQSVLGENYKPDSSWSEVGAKLWKNVTDGFDVSGDWIKQQILKDDYKPDSTWGDVGGRIIDEILNTSISNQQSIGTFLSGILESMKTYTGWASLGTQMGQVGSKIIEGITNAFVNTADIATKLVEGAGDVLGSDGGGSMIEGFGNMISSMVDAVAASIPLMDDAIAKFADAIGTAFTKINWNSATAALSNIGESILKAIQSGFTSVQDVGISLLNTIGSTLKNIPWEQLGGKLGDFGGTVLQAIVNSLADVKATEVISAIGTSIEAAVEGLSTAAGTIAGKLFAFLTSGENLEKFKSIGENIVKAIMQGMLELGPNFVKSSTKAFSNLLVGFMRGATGAEVDQQAVDELAELGAGTFEAVGDVWADAADENGMVAGAELLAALDESLLSTHGIDRAVAAYQTAIANGFAHYTREYPVLGNEIAVELYRGIATALENPANANWSDVVKKAVLLMATGYGDGLDAALERQSEFDGYEGLAEALKAILDNDTSISQLAKELGISIAQLLGYRLKDGWDLIFGSDEGLYLSNGEELFRATTENMKMAMQDAADDIVDSGNVDDTVYSAGKEAAVQFGLGFSNHLREEKSSSGNGGFIPFNTQALQNETYTAAQEAAASMNAGFESGGDPSGALTSAAESIVSAASGVLNAESGAGIGANFVAGIASGISGAAGTAIAAAVAVAVAALAAAKSALGIHSPSKLAEDQVGNNFTFGIAEGVVDKIRYVQNAAEEVATSALSTAKQAVSGGNASELSKAFAGALSIDSKSTRIPVATGAENISRISTVETNTQTNADNGGESIAETIANALATVKVLMDSREVGRLVAPTVGEVMGREALNER